MAENIQTLQEKVKELKMQIAYKDEHQKRYKVDGSKDVDQQKLNLLEKALSDAKGRGLLNG